MLFADRRRRQRSHNQDSLGVSIARTDAVWNRRGHLFIVADGMAAVMPSVNSPARWPFSRLNILILGSKKTTPRKPLDGFHPYE